MAVSVEMQHTGDPASQREVAAVIEHMLADRPGDWRVSVVGSQANDRWEMKIVGPNGFERSYTLEGSAGQHEPQVIAKLVARMGARIVAVAETFEMLVRDRPHRGARAFAIAGAEVQRWSDRVFDPRIVDVLLKVPDEDWQTALLALSQPACNPIGDYMSPTKLPLYNFLSNVQWNTLRDTTYLYRRIGISFLRATSKLRAMADVRRLRRNAKPATCISAHALGVLIVSLSTCRPCSPTTVLAIADGRNNRIVIAADSLVQHRYSRAESRCKIHVVTNDCTFAMVGMYKQDTPAFDLFALGQSACRSNGDLKQRADYFLSTALPQLVEVVKDLAITDAAYLKQHNDGKPIIEVLFIGAYEDKPVVFARGVVLENGILKPETISVPTDSVHLFAGVNGHIREYINSHPRWEQGGDISAAQRLIRLEVAAHPDMVGLPISIGTVDSSGRFHWIQRGKCED